MSLVDDDWRIGRLLRLMRRRSELTQEQLSEAAEVPVREIIRVERGEVGLVSVDRTRRLFLAAGGRARLGTWYNGASADRLLDERHAALVEQAAAVLVRRGWRALSEATFSEYGERGSIDLFAAYPQLQAVAVCEIKSDIGSLEEMNRVFDIKVRLAPKLAGDRFGFRPAAIGRILILPEDRTVRRVIDSHVRTLATLYPARSREVRAWLRQPDQSIGGIWFLSEMRFSPAGSGPAV